MKYSIMKNKNVLAVDSQTDLLLTLKEKILGICPECRLDIAATFEEARQFMLMLTYDLIVSDIMTSPGSRLVDMVVSRNLPVLVLFGNGTSREDLIPFNSLRIQAVLPKENVTEIVPVIEKALKSERLHNGKLALKKLRHFSRLVVHGHSTKGRAPVFHDYEAIYY